MHLFDHEGVYYTTVFGNHDTESFDYYSRIKLGEIYEKNDSGYCLFNSDFSDPQASMPSVSNQFITINNTDGSIRKLLLMLDTNSYEDKKIKSTIDWNYDTLHQDQIDWAEKTIKDLSSGSGLPDGEYLDTIAFFHIPIGEYQVAYKELESNGFEDTEDSKYLFGVWDEEINEELGIRVWFGGCSKYTEDPKNSDSLFETLGPEGLDCLDACVCGHDHTNNAAVLYKGVKLIYGYSLDNLAYDDIAMSGTQRGCISIMLHPDGTWEETHKNAYLDCGADPDMFYDVYLDRFYVDGAVPN